MSRDGDRERKSWREIDQGRDKSSHRPGGGGGSGSSGRAERSQAYRAYKTQLNKLFDGGGALPDALKEKLGDTEVSAGAKKKKAAAAAIIDSATLKDLRQALRAYRAEYGFPDDEDALARILDLSCDDEEVLEVLQTLSTLRAEGALKRAASFKARIKTAMVTVDDPEVQTTARELLAAL